LTMREREATIRVPPKKIITRRYNVIRYNYSGR
jgi:hypothetical protein